MKTFSGPFITYIITTRWDIQLFLNIPKRKLARYEAEYIIKQTKYIRDIHIYTYFR